MKHSLRILSLCLISVLALSACTYKPPANSSTSGNKNNAVQSVTSAALHTPKALSEDKTYTAVIEIADYGTIKILLDQKSAPISAANFAELARDGFYNGLTFHRIMKDFMMQGGCPLGNGTGNPGYSIKGEFAANGVENNLKHTRGAVSMARSNAPDSAGSQFFIVHETSSFLDGRYAVFGYVTEGMDVVDAVCNTAEPTDNNGTIPKASQPVITSITIHEA